MSAVTWAITADLDRDGTFETDLTGYVERPGNGVRISRGIGDDGVYRVSTMTIDLSNKDGTFTPRNMDSPFYGRLETGIPIRITATHNSIGYTLWTGYIDRYTTDTRVGQVPIAKLECSDLAGYLKDSEPVNVLTSTSRDTDGALDAIRTALGLAAGDVSWDDGVEDLPYHWCAAQGAMEAMGDVVRAEKGGRLWVNAAGQLRFEARNSRLGTTPDDNWGDYGAGVIYPSSIAVIQRDSDVTTSVRARATIVATGQADEEIFRFTRGMATQPTADSLALTAGFVYEREFTTHGAYFSITTPVAGTDYAANDAANGSGTDRTSLLSVTVTDHGGGRFRIKLVNTHSGTIYLTLFRLRGQPAPFFADRPESVFTKSVTGRKAGRTAQIDIPFSADNVALRDYAYSYLRTFRYPTETVHMEIHAKNDIAKVALLSVEIGDLIRYGDTSLGVDYVTNQKAGAYVDDWWYVSSIEYSIPPDWAGQDFLAKVVLEPSYIFRNLEAIEWDDFARTDAVGDLGTSTSGAAWATDTGFDIASSKARANTDTESIATLDLGGSVADMVAEVSLAAIGVGDEVGLSFRHTDANNQYRAYVDKAAGHLVLEKNVAGSVTAIERTDSYAAEVLADSPVGYWRLGESSGTVAVDLGSGGNNGTYVGSPTLGATGALTGDSDTAARFDGGATQKVTVPNIAAYRLATTNWSFELWAKREQSTFEGLIGCGGGNGTGWFCWFEGGPLRFTAGAQTKTPVANWPLDGAYRHVAITYDGATLRGYLNGVADTPITWAMPAPTDVATALFIAATTDARFKGSVDEVAIYDTALSAARILAHYNAGITSPAFAPGTSHELRAMIQGTRIRVWADYELMIDTTDAALATGTKFGIFARTANGTTTFDDPYGQGL